MKVRVHRNWATRGVSVFIYEAETMGRPLRILHSAGDDVWRWDEAAPEVNDLKPTFTLPEEALEALVKEASGLLPPSEAQASHLKDAIAVRDRLLTLFEKDL